MHSCEGAARATLASCGLPYAQTCLPTEVAHAPCHANVARLARMSMSLESSCSQGEASRSNNVLLCIRFHALSKICLSVSRAFFESLDLGVDKFAIKCRCPRVAVSQIYSPVAKSHRAVKVTEPVAIRVSISLPIHKNAFIMTNHIAPQENAIMPFGYLVVFSEASSQKSPKIARNASIRKFASCPKVLPPFAFGAPKFTQQTHLHDPKKYLPQSSLLQNAFAMPRSIRTRKKWGARSLSAARFQSKSACSATVGEEVF